MNLSFSLNNIPQGPYYICYSPVLCSLKITDGQAGDSPISVQISNNTTLGGQMIFYLSPNSTGSPAISLLLPRDGSEVKFYIGGKYNAASVEDGDAAIRFSINGQNVLMVKLMVRLRKDANTLTSRERDRFLNAFVTFVLSGQYENFLAMHGEASDEEIHGRASFLPWHRIFVLDLERHLQKIDASVSIPYWNFQYKADKVFTLEFMGMPASNSVGQLLFSPLNPLNNWRLQNLPRLARSPASGFDPLNDKALVEDELVTLGRGPDFYQFRKMESNPHGFAHVSWNGPIDFPSTAPQDPLFFMLHANVDRLWAAWQFQDPSNNLFKISNSDAYKPDGFPDGPNPRIGDFANDTFWPWNGIMGSPRPPTAPGGPLINSPFSKFPGGMPTVTDTIDYQGKITGQALYYDYDSLPYIPIQPLIHTDSFIITDADIHLDGLRNNIIKQFKNSEFFKQQLNNAEQPVEIISALSNLSMITDENGITKAMSLLKDNSFAPGERVLALTRLSSIISSDKSEIEYVLQLLVNTQETPELRGAALHIIKSLSFNSPFYKLIKPEIIQAFRGLLNDQVKKIRQDAIGFLAKDKDEFVQRLLINGLEDPSKAVVPEELAIHLLGFDIHAGIYPILRNIVYKSSNLDSRVEAIHLLGGDINSKDLLLNIFNNKKERFDVRKNSLLALKQQQLEIFIELAENTILDKNENENLRAISINALKYVNSDKPKRDGKFIEGLKDVILTASPILIEGISSYLKHNNE